MWAEDHGRQAGRQASTKPSDKLSGQQDLQLGDGTKGWKTLTFGFRDPDLRRRRDKVIISICFSEAAHLDMSPVYAKHGQTDVTKRNKGGQRKDRRTNIERREDRQECKKKQRRT